MDTHAFTTTHACMHAHTHKQIDRQTDIHTDRQTDIQTDIQTYRHTDRQTDRQTHTHTHIHTHTSIPILSRKAVFTVLPRISPRSWVLLREGHWNHITHKSWGRQTVHTADRTNSLHSRLEQWE